MSVLPPSPTLMLVEGAGNVLNFPGIDPTGATDSTAAFQSAWANYDNIVAPGRTPAGTLCQYLIAGQLTVPQNGSLTCAMQGPSAVPGNGYYGTDSSGQAAITINPNTIPGLLKITGNSGSANGTSPFTMNSNSTIQNGVAYYPNQAQLGSSSSAPTAYPYFITMGTGSPSVGVNTTFRNFCVVNPYQLVNVAGAWRPTIEGIVSQPYAMGVNITNCFDVARLHNIHFECFWDAYQPSTGYFYQPWTYNTGGVGYNFERCDLLQMVDCFAYGVRQGLILTSQDTTAANSPWATFTAVHFDGCPQPITIDYVQNYGANFSNCMVTSGNGTAVTIASTCTGPVTFANCLLTSNGTALTQAGSGQTILANCQIYALSNTGTSAIVHSGGGLIVSANNFATNTVQYTNATGATYANLTGNHCKTSVSMTNTVSIAAFNQANNLAY